MGTRYHYDRNGRYRGKTTDKPDDGGWVGLVFVLFLFYIFIGGCVKGC